MTTLRIIERQLQQAKMSHGGVERDDISLSKALTKLHTTYESEKAAAVQEVEQRVSVQIATLKMQLEQVQGQLAAVRNGKAEQQARHSRELRLQILKLTQEHEACMVPQQAKATRDSEVAMSKMHGELDRERAARMQAETQVATLRETHASVQSLLDAINKIKASAPAVKTKPVKSAEYAFEIRRRGDGLIAEVIAKTL
jgi:TolA-binding protein